MSEGKSHGCRICRLELEHCQCEEMRRQVEERKKAEAAALAGDTEGENGNPSECEAPTAGVIDSATVRKYALDRSRGYGILYALLHHGKFVYVWETGEWLYWGGHHWFLDDKGKSAAAMERVVALLRAELRVIGAEIGAADAAEDKAEVARLGHIRKALKSGIDSLHSASGRSAALSFAWSNDVLSLVISSAEIDQKPWLLACKNGEINLRTGALRDGRPENFLLKAAPVEWRGIDAAAPHFRQGIETCLDGDRQKTDFLQRLFGSMMPGLQTEDVLPVLSGSGSNGKTKIVIGPIMGALGDLAVPLPAEFLLDQGKVRSSAAPSPDQMMLRGALIAFAEESDEGKRIASSRAKHTTGGSRLMSARNPHDRKPSTWRPTHSIVLSTNFKPYAPANDYAFWRRVVVIEFPVRFVNDGGSGILRSGEKTAPADPELPKKIEDELSGVLAWLVEGCLAWQQRGLDPPPAVIAATTEYQAESDLLGLFIKDSGKCRLGEGLATAAGEFYAAFEAWYSAEIGSGKPPSKIKVGKLIKKYWFDIDPRRDTNYYIGVSIV